jgi:hypothetical protein
LKTVFKALAANPLFVLAFVYFISAKGHLEIIDTAYSVRTAQAIIEEGSMLIDPVDPRYREVAPKIKGTENIYSQYGIGILVIFLPIVACAKVISSLLGIQEPILTQFLLSFYNLPFAILALWHFKNILKGLGGSEMNSNFLMLCLGVGTVFWKYSVTDFSEITQISLLLGALREYLRDSERKWQGVSLYLAFLVAFKMVYVLLIPFFGLLALHEGFKKKELVRNSIHLSSFLIPCAAILMIANFVRFDSILETGYGAPGASFSFACFKRDFLDYIYSLKRGILPFSPLLLMGIVMWRRFYRGHPKFALLVGGMALFWLCLMASYKGLQGGWCWGNRNLFPMVPLLAIPWVFVDWKNLLERLSFACLLIISLTIQIVGVSLKTHEYSVILTKIHENPQAHELPEQLPGSILLFWEKTTNASGTYDPDFITGHTSQSMEKIDLTGFESFQGFNFWLVHGAKKWLPELVGFIGNFHVIVLLALTIFSLGKYWPPEISTKQAEKS